MEVRNLKHNGLGSFDCELNHPTHGWIPFTSVPDDTDLESQALYEAIVRGQYGEPAAFQVPKPVIPSVVTMRQARLALLGAGILDDVETALAAMEGDAGKAARIEWDYSSEVHRHKPFVQGIGTLLGLTEEAIDQLFITAASID